ncbi:MAG: WD40 domain-containing protein [Chloroflexi bacterium OLB15]|nr:MAG: WD40 domain-containing protein [Chloroflexi bacterium OLB15]
MLARLIMVFPIVGLVSLIFISVTKAAGSLLPRQQLTFLSYHQVNPDIFLSDINSGITRNLTNNPAYDGAYAWSNDGSWLAFISDRAGGLSLFVMNSTGGEVRQLTPAGDNRGYGGIRWTNDGRIVFFSRTDPNNWFAVYPDGSGFEQIASNETPITGIALDLDLQADSSYWPRSPDNTRIAYASYVPEESEWGVFLTSNEARTDSELLVLTGREGVESITWSPDSTYVAYVGTHDRISDVYIVPARPGNPARRLTATRAIEAAAQWRPLAS